MRSPEKIFIGVLTLLTFFLCAVMVQNIRIALVPTAGKAKMDVAALRAEWQRLGIVPHEAKYWVPLRHKDKK